MNRRGFLDSILKAGVSAMILPSAVTYAGRVWKKTQSPIFTMRWNGEIRLEDTIIAMLPRDHRFIVPIIFKRIKPIELGTWPMNMGQTINTDYINLHGSR